MTSDREKAADLLEIIWRGIPTDYKSRYRRTIWQQFEDQVRSAAYTSHLGQFVNALCVKFQATVGQQTGEHERAEEILNSGRDKDLLKLMRTETTLLVLMVRVRNQARQEEWKARQAEIEAEEAAMNDPTFGLPMAKGD